MMISETVNARDNHSIQGSFIIQRLEGWVYLFFIQFRENRKVIPRRPIEFLHL